MKVPLTILILLIFTSYEQYPCGISVRNPTTYQPSGYPKSASDCKDDSLSSQEKDKLDLVHCCFIEKKKDELDSDKSCEAFTSRQMKKLGTIIKNREESAEFNYEISIDCSSSFLKTCLILLLSFIFL